MDRKENISYYLCIYCYDGRWRMVIWCLERNIRNTRVLDWHKPTNSSLTVDSLPRSWVSIEQTNVQSRGLRQKCRAPGAPFISYYLKIIKVTEKLRWVLLLHATVMKMKAKPKMTTASYTVVESGGNRAWMVESRYVFWVLITSFDIPQCGAVEMKG